MIIQLVLNGFGLALSTAGAVIMWISVKNDDFFDVELGDSVLYLFAIAVVINLLMFVDAGLASPVFVVAAVAMSYFWIPFGIDLTDQWREQLENKVFLEFSKDKLEMAVIGGCLALGGSFVGIVASCLIPWKRDIKVPRIWELIVFIGAIVTLGGCISLFCFNARGDSNYDKWMMIAIQGILSLAFGISSAVFPDPYIVSTAAFMTAFTFVQAMFQGVGFLEGEDIDGSLSNPHSAQVSLLVAAIGLALMWIGLGGAHTTKPDAGANQQIHDTQTGKGRSHAIASP